MLTIRFLVICILIKLNFIFPIKSIPLPANSPAFLSSSPQNRLLSQRIADRNRIEDDRIKHSTHLHVQMVTALGSSMLGLTKAYVKNLCTSKSCSQKKQETQNNLNFAKKTIFEPIKRNRSAAKEIRKEAEMNKEYLTKDYRLARYYEMNNIVEQMPDHLKNIYTDENTKIVRNKFDNQRSQNWKKGQNVSKSARNPKYKDQITKTH